MNFIGNALKNHRTANANKNYFIPVDCVRAKIWNDDLIYVYYKQNLMFFVKKDKLENFPALFSEASRPCLDLVHPELYKGHGLTPSFKIIIKNMILSLY